METSLKLCLSCLSPKAVFTCGLCAGNLCKNCQVILKEGSFAFLPKIPSALGHRLYCGPCYERQVAPELETYAQTMERAKGVFVFLKSKGEETRRMKRLEKPITVPHCADKEETILRLAFLATQAGFNALVDVDIVCKKIRNFAYQTTQWSGTAVPTRVDSAKLERETTRIGAYYLSK